MEAAAGPDGCLHSSAALNDQIKETSLSAQPTKPDFFPVRLADHIFSSSRAALISVPLCYNSITET